MIPYEPGRRRELRALMEAVWGTWWSDEELDWWFDSNPSGPSLISLGEQDGRIVGMAGMSPYRMLLAGREVRVAVALHLATHPDYRRRGVLTMLERENEKRAAERSPVALVFPNAASRQVLVGLGWRALPGPRVFARPTRRRALPDGVEPVEDFGAGADALWRLVAPLYGAGLVRDAAYLRWRFAVSPRGYMCLEAGDGVAVVGRTELRGKRVAYLAELVAEPGPATRRLLRAALAVAEAPLFLALPPAGRTGDLVRLGFLPTSRRISVLGKQMQPAGRLPRRLLLSLGDLDTW